MKLSPKLKIVAFTILIVLFFLSLNLTFIGKEIKNIFYLASFPIQKGFWGAGDKISGFFELITEMENLKRENEELKLKIQELLVETASLKELKKENEILREALEIGLEKEFKLILTEIAGKDISQDSLIISKGLEEGVSEGMPVITQQKFLAGRISEVYKNFSKVMLISNKGSSFDAKTLDTDILGVIKGGGNLEAFFDLIPQEKEIKEGDLIITSALGRVFPEGLLVGNIEEVKRSDIEVWQKAEIKPFFDIKKTEILFVIASF